MNLLIISTGGFRDQTMRPLPLNPVALWDTCGNGGILKYMFMCTYITLKACLFSLSWLIYRVWIAVYLQKSDCTLRYNSFVSHA